MQALAHQIQQGKTSRTFIVILSPVVQIPAELEKHFVVIEHDLPDRQQLQKIAEGIATEDGEMPEGEDLRPPAGRGGGPDPLRGRGGVQPVAGPARQADSPKRCGS